MSSNHPFGNFPSPEEVLSSEKKTDELMKELEAFRPGVQMIIATALLTRLVLKFKLSPAVVAMNLIMATTIFAGANGPSAADAEEITVCDLPEEFGRHFQDPETFMEFRAAIKMAHCRGAINHMFHVMIQAGQLPKEAYEEYAALSARKQQ